jgi:hypothetical protein
MSPIMFFTVTFEPNIFLLFKVIEHFRDIYSELSLWWPISNGLVIQKRPFVTPDV